MITCFENLIGIKTQCGEPTVPDSGYYLQDLPLINLKLADSVSDGVDSGYQYLKDKLDFATNNLANDVRTRMAPYFLQNSVIENMQVGFYQDNRQFNPGIADTYKGIQIRVSEYQYLNVFLSSVSIYCDYTGQIEIKVIDLVQSKVLDTIPINAVAGQIVTIPLFKNYASNGQYVNLFIGYDSTGIASYTSNIWTQPGRFGACSTCRPCHTLRNKYLILYSRSLPKQGPWLMNSVKGINECGGLSVTVSLNCSIDKWLCQMKSALSFALLYRAGIEILKEAINSPRFNSLITLGKEQMRAILEDYEMEYGKAMDGVFKNLRLPNDICFKCNSKINTGFATL